MNLYQIVFIAAVVATTAVSLFLSWADGDNFLDCVGRLFLFYCGAVASCVFIAVFVGIFLRLGTL